MLEESRREKRGNRVGGRRGAAPKELIERRGKSCMRIGKAMKPVR